MCPLCGVRKARRACPALNQSICTVCCATKRLVEIRCPDSCIYLTAAREHPSAAIVRQQRTDIALLTQAMQDLNDRQTRLLASLCHFVAAYESPELHRLVDQDVEEAASALAATLETAARGVIYEHAPTSAAAIRLSAEMRPLIQEAIKGGGTAAERDAAVALRKFEGLVKGSRSETGSDCGFKVFLGRLLGTRETAPVAEHEAPRLIVP